MIKVYGIKTCGSVRNALKFFKDNNIEVEFSDFKKETPSSDKVKTWTQKSDINVLFNSKGTKYKTLNLKELNHKPLFPLRKYLLHHQKLA